jgi:hypothetical protein
MLQTIRNLILALSLGALVLSALSLSACAAPTPTQPPASETVDPRESYPGITEPQPGEAGGEVEPYPGVLPEEPVEQGYPGLEEPAPNPPAFTAPQPSGYEPQAGDEQLTRGEVFIEPGDSQLLVMESFPVQVTLALSGNLPDPCHALRVVVSSPDEQNRVYVEVYSMADPGQICTAVLEPFNAQVPLGSFAGGEYQVYINGELFGTFQA